MITFGERRHGRRYLERPGAYGVLLGHDRHILTVETPDGRFYLPGGGIRPGETAERALCREFREETGLNIECGEPFASAQQIVQAVDEPTGYIKQCHFHLVENVSDTAAPGEFAIRWMNLQKACDELFEDAHKWAVEQLHSKPPD